MPDPSKADFAEQADLPEPANLKFLRILVTVLTAVMICGVVLIIALIVMRFNQTPDLLPETVELPAGKTARAITHGGDWYAVVTTGDEILIFDSVTGQLRQTVQITPAE